MLSRHNAKQENERHQTNINVFVCLLKVCMNVLQSVIFCVKNVLNGAFKFQDRVKM